MSPLLAQGRSTDLERRYVDVLPWKPPFPCFSCSLQGSHFKQNSLKISSQDPFSEKFQNFSLVCLKFCLNFSSQIPKFENFSSQAPSFSWSPLFLSSVTYFPNYVTHRPKWKWSCIFFDFVVSNNLHNHEIILWHEPNSVDRVLSIFAGCNIRFIRPRIHLHSKSIKPCHPGQEMGSIGCKP